MGNSLLKFRVFAVLLILLFTVTAFGLDTKPWTIMVYLDADNNLEEAGLDDYIEMAKVGSDTNVNIIVQMDRIGGYATSYDNWTGTKRFYVVQGSTPVSANQVSDLGELNMGDPQTAKDFILWTMTNYPADHYALVFWDHGDGWARTQSLRSTSKKEDPHDPGITKGACSDETNNDYLYFTEGEFEDIFSYAYALNGNQKLDLVGFDVCLDGMWENMVASEPYFQYFVASEMNEWGEGWSYWYFLQELADSDGTLTAKQLADYIVEAYENGDNGSNNPDPSNTGWTQSSIDLSQIPNLTSAIDNFAQELACAKQNGYSTEITNARSNTFECDSSSQVDLYHFCTNIRNESVPGSLVTAASGVQTAINQAVSRNYRVAYYPNNNGIAIYYPESGYNSYYNSTHTNVTSTYWDNFLNGGSCPEPVLISYSEKAIDDSAGNSDGVIDPGENISMTVTLINMGTDTATNVSATISTSDTYISVISNSSTYPDIGSGVKEDSNTPYTFSVDSGCPSPRKVDFLMQVTADSYSNSFTFNVSVGEIPILLVIDDNSDGGESYYRNALNNNGYLFDEVVVGVGSNGPSQATMEEYGLVIWFTGDDWDDTLSATDETNLQGYLNKGGALLFSSQDYLYQRSEVSSFDNNYLHVDTHTDDVGITRNLGVPCDPVTDGMDLNMSYPFTNYSDSINSVGNGAIRMFKTLGNVTSAVRYPDDYDNDSYHVIFLPFPFEAVPTDANPNNRDTLMKNMVDWLLGDYVFSNTDPSAFSLQSPSDGATGVNQPIALNWTDSTDPDAPCDSVKYRIYYGTSPTLTTYTTVGNITDSDYSLSGLESETTYYWKVKVTDEHGGFYETGIWSFQTAPNQPPGAFVLLTPTDNSKLEEYPIKFTWQTSVDPDGDTVNYDLWYSTDNSFTTKTVVNNISGTQYTLNAEISDGTYYWKVFVSDGINPDVECTGTFSFDFELAPFGDNLEEVRIYPNPANPLEQPIIFDKLPRNGELLIYTLMGELILQVDIESPEYAWRGLNAGGKLISSGIYLVVIKDENGNATSRKMAIIKK